MFSFFKSRQFFYFILTGGLAALVNIITRFIFSFFFNFTLSIFLSYLIAMVFAYYLAGRFVFKKSKKPIYSSFALFSLINLLAICQTLLISIITREYLSGKMINFQYINLISHTLGVTTPVFTSFIGHKYFSFKD